MEDEIEFVLVEGLTKDQKLTINANINHLFSNINEYEEPDLQTLKNEVKRACGTENIY